MIRTITLILLSVFALNAHAQTDTLYSMDAARIRNYLPEGTYQYLVFYQNNKKPKMAGAYLWSRAVKFKKLNNREVIEIEQKWYSTDSANYRYVYSLVDRQTFLPIHHRTWMQRMGTEAYDFYADKIVGSDTVKNNSKAGFVVANLPHTTLNWELDLETFPLLPLKANRTFAINFYHPGGRTEPKLYEYKVIGDTVLPGPEGSSIVCWKLKIEYGAGSSAVFYISKKKHQVLKMEEVYGQVVRYKVLLPGPIPVL